MNKAIIGKKLGMTQVFSPDGKVIPVTVVEAGPCPVVQIKTLEGDALVAADVSNDGKVDASDALLILQHSVNLIDHFPVEE